jgi:lipoyl(octanoyl) transferase
MNVVDRTGGVEWLASDGPLAYPDAVAFMERRIDGIRRRGEAEAVWLLEHPPLYTAGTSAHPAELIEPGRFPVYRAGRGGRYTYHGPGQRVAYVMLDLRRRGSDVRAFVHGLEDWLIATLACFGVRGERRCDRIGVWVADGAGGEAKIAALGIRVRRWVSYHGVAVNVDPELDHFNGIVPCGLAGHAVTSLRAQGVPATMAEVDACLRRTFAAVPILNSPLPGPAAFR